MQQGSQLQLFSIDLVSFFIGFLSVVPSINMLIIAIILT